MPRNEGWTLTTAKSNVAPLAVGLVIGIMFIILFTLPIPGYPLLSERFLAQHDADYTPLLQMRIIGLEDSYNVGERVDFAVRQIAGGDCVLPELIMVKDLGTGEIIQEWSGTNDSTSLFCRIITNPATSGTTWTTKTLENPVIFNQAGSYTVVAKHLFMTVQKEFSILAVGDDGNDTSQRTIDILSSKSEDLDTVNTLLQKYPNANVTVTANFHSNLFQEFGKYHPNGIVQYSVAKTDQRPSPDSADSDKQGRELTVTIIFDRYYENNSFPLVHVTCMGENYSSLYIRELYVPPSEIENC